MLKKQVKVGTYVKLICKSKTSYWRRYNGQIGLITAVYYPHEDTYMAGFYVQWQDPNFIENEGPTSCSYGWSEIRLFAIPTKEEVETILDLQRRRAHADKYM